MPIKSDAYVDRYIDAETTSHNKEEKKRVPLGRKLLGWVGSAFAFPFAPILLLILLPMTRRLGDRNGDV